MVDSVLYDDRNGVMLDVDVLNNGSIEGIFFSDTMISLQEEETGSGVGGSISERTIITVEHRYEERVNNLSIFTP